MDSKTALTCVVPNFDFIENSRKEYDPAYSRWMPHFNVGCFPFYSPKDYPAYFDKIQSVCSKYKSINIVMNKLGTFPVSNGSKGTLFLEITDEKNMLKNLYAELVDTLGIKSKEFHPHVTVGRFDSADKMDSVKNNMIIEEMQFTLEGLTLISRFDNTQFEACYFFPFGLEVFRDVRKVSESIKADVCNFGDFYVFNLKSFDQDEDSEDVNIANFLLIDNSGSMGTATKHAVDIMGKGMLNMPVSIVPGELILFHHNVSVKENISEPSQLANIRYPKQGRTNITLAIKTAIDRILKHNKVYKNCHYVLSFLSDGHHNEGPTLTETQIIQMRQKIAHEGIVLSIIIVGISDSDTSLGMKIKTGLETVPLHSLESVYYAKTTLEMKTVLKELTEGCRASLKTGSSKYISVEGGNLIENNTYNTCLFFDHSHTLVVKSADGKCPKLFVDNKVVQFSTKDVDQESVTSFVQYVLPKLSQLKVAHGNTKIETQLVTLEKFIDDAETILRNLKAPEFVIGTNKLSAQNRVKLLKQAKQSQISFQEERNRLLMLKSSISNNSAQQAEYLTGITKKFANKAVLRSDTVSVSMNDVLNEIEKLRDDLMQNLQDMEDNDETSLLSLNTAREQLEEWLNFDRNQFDNIYSLLVYFGFTCYPVEFEHNNAVQMDPFQTRCKYIEPYMMDTCSLMLANQINHPVSSPSRRTVTDGLILFDSTASLLLKKTHIYKYLCSVALCRDLYMFHPRMTFAMHSHSLMAAIDQFAMTGSTVYLDLAGKIVNSFKLTNETNDKLFNRWWKEWGTVTQSEEDGCNHPIQLLLLMCCKKITREESSVPLINLMNEVLARKMKMLFAHHENPMEKVVAGLQKLMGINDSNSPKPDPDIMKEEPTVISVRESCQFWADIADESVIKDVYGAASIREFVTKELLSYYRLFEYALMQGSHVDQLSQHLSKIKQLDLTENVMLTMFLQAAMHQTSNTRVGINEKSVLESETLHDLIRDLRMAIYFDLCKVKKSEWLKIIGDVTYAEALTSDVNVFSSMIGVHTHGLNKEKFWAMLKAAIHNDDKISVFKSKSNYTIEECLAKVSRK